MPQVAVLPGDGIGPEVIAEAVKVLKVALGDDVAAWTLVEAPVGWAAIDLTDEALPASTAELCKQSDAVLFGAVGMPARDASLPPSKRPEPVALLGLRRGLFANLRPAILYPEFASQSVLRPDIVAGGIDVLIVRELTGGLYYGQPKGREGTGKDERAVDTMRYSTAEVQRIARVAFDAARLRNRRLCSVDKANILATSQLWRDVVNNVARDYRDVEVSHMYVDNCAMQLLRNPRQFDVILTENTFGDILSDEASMLVGSLGMLPSASLGDGGATEFYEPIHGSAPDIAGKGVANPIGAVLTIAMMLRYTFHLEATASAVDQAVRRVLEQGYRTPDIVQPGMTHVGTGEMGDLIAREVTRSVASTGEIAR
jgi:3-isopropylmalate dehydrogenase